MTDDLYRDRPGFAKDYTGPTGLEGEPTGPSEGPGDAPRDSGPGIGVETYCGLLDAYTKLLGAYTDLLKSKGMPSGDH